MAQKIVISQTNFTGGQVDEDANRREDDKTPKNGARLMTNWRIRNTGTLRVRPGRNAIALSPGPRAERFRMSPTQELIIVFSTARIDIYDRLALASVSNVSGNYLWTNSTVGLINWTVTPDRIVVCYPGMRPQIILWNFATNTFTFQQFTFRTYNGQVMEPFFRTLAPGETIQYSNYFGSVNLVVTAPFFTSNMVGQSLSIGGNQVVITSVINSQSATANVQFALTQPTNFTLTPPGSSSISGASAALWSGDANLTFPIHTIIQTATTKAVFEVTNVDAKLQIDAIQLTATIINADDFVVSQFGAAPITAVNNSLLPQPMITWQQEFMNSVVGWPQACFYDHGRLGFCDFPQRPEAILWSAIGIYDHFWVDTTAALTTGMAGTDANAGMLEFIDGKPRVRNVVGWNGDVFAFTDKGVYVIPVAAAGNPLKPGSVEFRFVSDASASGLKPAVSRDAVVFTSASGSRVSAMIRTGNFTSPYAEIDITEFHSSLINTPVAITVGHGDDGFPERYVYVLNTDGSVVVGKVDASGKAFVGWVPWTGAGSTSWVSAAELDVLFTVLYADVVYGNVYVLEYEDLTKFLDHSVNLHSPPAPMLLGGKGPFYAFSSQTVRVMDGNIDYGLRNVDANGFLIVRPEDDFSSASLIAGAPFVSTFSPFLEEGGRGPAQGQRQRRRKIARAIVAVYGSSGFTFGGRTIPPFDFGQNPLAQPTLKETTYTARFIGRDFDPQVMLIKDNPGPLTIIEFNQEVTV